MDYENTDTSLTERNWFDFLDKTDAVSFEEAVFRGKLHNYPSGKLNFMSETLSTDWYIEKQGYFSEIDGFFTPSAFGGQIGGFPSDIHKAAAFFLNREDRIKYLDKVFTLYDLAPFEVILDLISVDFKMFKPEGKAERKTVKNVRAYRVYSEKFDFTFFVQLPSAIGETELRSMLEGFNFNTDSIRYALKLSKGFLDCNPCEFSAGDVILTGLAPDSTYFLGNAGVWQPVYINQNNEIEKNGELFMTSEITSKMPISLSVVTGKITLNGEDLAALSEGNVIPLGVSPKGQVLLMQGDHVVAKGELVLAGDELAVRILTEPSWMR